MNTLSLNPNKFECSDICCPSCSDDEATIYMTTVNGPFGCEDVCPMCGYALANYSHEWDIMHYYDAV